MQLSTSFSCVNGASSSYNCLTSYIILLRRHHVVICVSKMVALAFMVYLNPFLVKFSPSVPLQDSQTATFACPDSLLLKQDGQLMLSLSKKTFLETCLHRQRHGRVCGVEVIVTQILVLETGGLG